MRNYAWLIAVPLLFASCRHRISGDEIARINGYWQIEKVITADGDQKDYQGNTAYDFYEIKDGKGFRTKVMPQLDGSFLTNNIREKIEVSHDDDGTYLNYTTEYAKWRERVEAVDDNELVVENGEKIEYHYKKAGPIKIE